MKKIVNIAWVFLLLISCVQEDSQSSLNKPSKELSNDPVSKSQALSSGTLQPESDENVYKVVDEMPLFGGCLSLDCSNEKLIGYIQEKIKYPELAKKEGLEGKVFVQFVVQVDGSVSDVNIVRDLGFGTGEVVAKVVEGINDLEVRWTAGILDRVKVPVLYTLPVSFVLE